MENSIKFPSKLRIELAYDLALPLLGIYPQKTVIHKYKCTPSFTPALFTLAKIGKQSKWLSIDEWITKMLCIYTMEYDSAIKKKNNAIYSNIYRKNNAIYSNMDGTGKVISLLFNMLSRLVTTFLPRSKCLLISWLQSPSAVILEPRKIKSDTVSTISPSICHELIGPDAMILVF